MMEIPQHLRDLAVSDSGFVFDPYTGATFTVNASGLAILRGLQRGLGRADIEAALRADFELEGDDPQRDIDEFVQLLRHYQIVPRDFASA